MALLLGYSIEAITHTLPDSKEENVTSQLEYLTHCKRNMWDRINILVWSFLKIQFATHLKEDLLVGRGKLLRKLLFPRKKGVIFLAWSFVVYSVSLAWRSSNHLVPNALIDQYAKDVDIIECQPWTLLPTSSSMRQINTCLFKLLL